MGIRFCTAGPSREFGSRVRRDVVQADRRLQHQHHIKPMTTDILHHPGNVLRFDDGFVDRLSKLLDQVLQAWVHLSLRHGLPPPPTDEHQLGYGQYLSTLRMPLGSLPCDIAYLGKYAIVGALDGPDRSKGAPIYILENDQLVSTIMPKEDLGLANFKHVHNAVLREYGDKLYVIAQAWNPGDFAILEQVTN